MDIFEYKLDNDIHMPDCIKDEFSDKNICFLDIETTGLSSKYNEIILIGLLSKVDRKVSITQFFANTIDEEYELLIAFEEYLSKFEYIVTYNGASFDLPFIKKRLLHFDIENNIDEIDHLDLLKLVRKNKLILKLENCKLKTVEKSLEIYREDMISGRESVSLYKDYEYTKDKYKRDVILKHNYDDIFYLPKLLSIYEIIDKEINLNVDAMFKGAPIVLKITKPSIVFKNNLIYIEGHSELIELPQQVYFKDIYSLNWNLSEGEINIELKYQEAVLSTGDNCLYIDLCYSELSYGKFDNLGYNVSNSIVLLKVDDNIIYDNILKLISIIISDID